MLFEEFRRAVASGEPARFASAHRAMADRLAGVWIADGSKLDAVARRLKVLWDDRRVPLPGSLLAFYDLRHGVLARPADSPDAQGSVRAASQRARASDNRLARAPGVDLVGRPRWTRFEHARPILAAMKKWMDEVAPTVLPKGPLGQAIAYATANWVALNRYLDEGYLGIDNNPAERALRGIAVGRKNWLFAGSADAGRRAAVLMTLVGSCRLQGIDPEIYVADVLVRVATAPASRVDELTPRGWGKARRALPASSS